MRVPLPALAPLLLVCCAGPTLLRPMPYAADRIFLDRHTRIHELHAGTGALLVAPDLQGRVMTACVEPNGASLGFVNRAQFLVDPREPAAFRNYGGVERFWVGPESGPYALFFEPGAPHERDNWRVPEDLDTGRCRAVTTADGLRLERTVRLENVLGTRFTMDVTRELHALDAAQAAKWVGTLPPGTRWTGWSSETTVVNAGDVAWTPAGGLPCIWMIGMFAPGDDAWVIAPFDVDHEDPDGGPPVRADYFGEVPPERFRIGDGFAVFRADARAEGKIGVLRNRATERIAAWDPDTGVLTVVVYGPVDREAPYLSEHWGERLPEPYYGDVANAYNSGSAPFFELESSSPALALAPGAAYRHRHVTLHLKPGGDLALATLVRGAMELEWEDVQDLIDG